MTIADKTYFATRDMRRLVPEDHPEAAFQIAVKGCEIRSDMEQRFNLPRAYDEQTPAPVKQPNPESGTPNVEGQTTSNSGEGENSGDENSGEGEGSADNETADPETADEPEAGELEAGDSSEQTTDDSADDAPNRGRSRRGKPRG